MAPDEMDHANDRLHYENLRRHRENAERDAAEERARESGCGLLWLVPVVLTLVAVVAVSALVAAWPPWTRAIVTLVPASWAESVNANWWAAGLLFVAVLTPIWLVAWGLAAVRNSIATRYGHGVLPGMVRWIWLLIMTTIRAFVTLVGLVTAWRVVSLIRGGELPEVPDVLAPAVVAFSLLLVASAIRAFALHRQLPRQHD